MNGAWVQKGLKAWKWRQLCFVDTILYWVCRSLCTKARHSCVMLVSPDVIGHHAKSALSGQTFLSPLQNKVPCYPPSGLSAVTEVISDWPEDKMLLTLLKQVMLGEASLTTMTGPVLTDNEFILYRVTWLTSQDFPTFYEQRRQGWALFDRLSLCWLLCDVYFLAPNYSAVSAKIPAA